MEQTPLSNRTHIAIYGNRNAGKSALLNAIVGQEVSLVSEFKGTTTDPVQKTMELLPLGPVVFIDTAGLDDQGELGLLRVKRTEKIFQRTDFAIYVLDGSAVDKAAYAQTIHKFKVFNIPYLTVINKVDTLSPEQIEELKGDFPQALFTSALKQSHILELKDRLIQSIEQVEAEPSLIGGLVPYNGTVVMVVPVDSEAPKGRLILPQVQLIRDCLDHGIKAHVVRDTELADTLKDLKKIDLVVTDSQAFGLVNQILPPSMPLTSFSILFARQKGDLQVFIEGVQALEGLKKGSRILISESCAHNHSHEDIGRIKIPKGLEKHFQKDFQFDFKMGHDFPQEDLSQYDLIIHCGSCMLNAKTMHSRIHMCREKAVPITNYGIVLAYLSGILPRSLSVFSQNQIS